MGCRIQGGSGVTYGNPPDYSIWSLGAFYGLEVVNINLGSPRKAMVGFRYESSRSRWYGCDIQCHISGTPGYKPDGTGNNSVDWGDCDLVEWDLPAGVAATTYQQGNRIGSHVTPILAESGTATPSVWGAYPSPTASTHDYLGGNGQLIPAVTLVIPAQGTAESHFDITNFPDGFDGMGLRVVTPGEYIDLVHDTDYIITTSGSDLTLTENVPVTFVRYNGVWCQQ